VKAKQSSTADDAAAAGAELCYAVQSEGLGDGKFKKDNGKFH
jgi:hypothetical protein